MGKNTLKRLEKLIDYMESKADSEDAYTETVQGMQSGKALSRALAYRASANMIRSEFFPTNAKGHVTEKKVKIN
jgi:hypothetical protein